MKKLLPILCIYTFICAIACILFGYFNGEIPQIVHGYEFKYRLYDGLLLFFNAVPAVLFTGITIGCAISFGKNPEGSEMRFSQAMLRRYKSIIILALVCSLLLTAVTELFVPIVSTRQNQLAQMPTMINDYISIGNDLYDQKQYQLARRYGQRALTLDPNSPEAEELMQQIDIALSTTTPTAIAATSVKSRAGVMTAAGSSTVYELRQKAENAMAQGDWFSAHYFAQTAIDISNERDMNRHALLEILSDSWNILSAPHGTPVTEEEKIFAKKVEGYSALMNGDNVHAYYVFHSLAQQSHALAIDPDIVRYSEIAEERLLNECFFIDEQSLIRNFESATDVYFSIQPEGDNENTKIVYIKGITNIPDSGSAVQYLRSLAIFDIDKNGNYISGLYVPYAKLLEADVSDYDDGMKKLFGIKTDVQFVPEILLRSVDRNDETNSIRPEYYYRDGNNAKQSIDHIFLPISFADYLLVTEASQGAEYMGLVSLYSFLPKAVNFGYSHEVFLQVLLDRLCYPIFILSFFLFLAAFAWNNRINKGQLFKFKWIFTFPLFTVLFYYINQLGLWIFKLQNYAILAITSSHITPFVSAAFYILLFTSASITFLSRNDSSKKERR